MKGRAPPAGPSGRVLELAERGAAEAFVAAHTVNTLRYLIRNHRDDATARRQVRLLLRLLGVVPVDEDRLLQALDLPVDDFGDAVQPACAEKRKVDVLVTRNVDDFAGLDLDVLSPVELLARLD